MLAGTQLQWLSKSNGADPRFALADSATCEILATRNRFIPLASDWAANLRPFADSYGRYVGAYGGYRLLLYAVPDKEMNK